MAGIKTDEFGDEYLNTYIWTQDNDAAGVTVTETAAGDLEWYCDTACSNEWWVQDFPGLTLSNFDIWTKITIPPYADVIGVDKTVGFYFSFGSDYNFIEAFLWFSDSVSKDVATCDPWVMGDLIAPRQFVITTDGWYETEEAIVDCFDHTHLLGVDQNVAWFRIRYVDQKASVWYALSEPSEESDWILSKGDFPIDMSGETVSGADPYFGMSQWGNPANHTDKTFKVEYVRSWPSQLVYDEFNDASIGPQWVNTDAAGAVTSESEHKLKMTQETGQQCLQEQANIPMGSQDVWCRMEIPPVTYSSAAASTQMWFEDGIVYDGGAGVALYATTTKGEFELSWWVYSDGYGEDYTGVLTFYQNYVYFRLKLDWDDPDMLVRHFYSLTEPTRDADWIELAGFTITTEWKPETFMSLYLSGNPDNSSTEREYFFSYFRKWWLKGAEAAEAPSLDQYQRLQGYPKVTHPLVFNRTVGQFEVMEQPRATQPSPTVDADYTLAYDGSGNLSTITMVVGGISYLKTLTYAAGNLSTISVWVEQ